MPKFSVIIPLFNKKAYIARCLKALYAQTLPPYEIIIVNDQSTDGSFEAAKAELKILHHQNTAIRTHLLENPVNLGPGASRNRGIEVARGDYLFFLDADDEYQPRLFEKITKLIKEQAADLIVFSYRRMPDDYIKPDINPCPAWLQTVSDDCLIMETPLAFVHDARFTLGPGSNAAVNRALLGETRYDETSKIYEGIEFWFRAVRRIQSAGGTCCLLTTPHHIVHSVPDSLIFKPLKLSEITPPAAVQNYGKSSDIFEKALYRRVAGSWFNNDIRRLASMLDRIKFLWRYRHLLPIALNWRVHR